MGLFWAKCGPILNLGDSVGLVNLVSSGIFRWCGPLG